MFWLRAVQIKRANNYMLMENEVRFASVFDGMLLNVPEPILLYLNGFSTIKDIGTGQQLIVNFPNLLETQIEGFGGYLGEIAKNNHSE